MLRMRWWSLFLFPVLLSAAPDIPFKLEEARERVAAPAFSAQDLAGRTFHSGKLKGKVTLMNFWATYCLPCRQEMPSLMRLQRAYPDRLRVITLVGAAGRRSKIERASRTYAAGLPILLDVKAKIRGMYGVRALPMTYIVDEEGMVYGRVRGAADWDGPRAHALVRGLLRGGVGAKR